MRLTRPASPKLLLALTVCACATEAMRAKSRPAGQRLQPALYSVQTRPWNSRLRGRGTPEAADVPLILFCVSPRNGSCVDGWGYPEHPPRISRNRVRLGPASLSAEPLFLIDQFGVTNTALSALPVSRPKQYWASMKNATPKMTQAARCDVQCNLTVELLRNTALQLQCSALLDASLPLNPAVRSRPSEPVESGDCRVLWVRRPLMQSRGTLSPNTKINVRMFADGQAHQSHCTNFSFGFWVV